MRRLSCVSGKFLWEFELPGISGKCNENREKEVDLMVVYLNKDGIREGVLGKKDGKEPDHIENGKELTAFLGQEFPLTDEEGDKLLGYIRGHGYLLGKMDGQLYRGDLCYDEKEIFWERYSINYVIDEVIQWNYDLMEDAEAEMRSPDNFPDFVKKKEYYDSLCADEEILDRIYMRIVEGIELGEPAQNLKDKMVQDTGRENGMEDPMEQLKEMFEEIQERNAKALAAKGGRGR